MVCVYIWNEFCPSKMKTIRTMPFKWCFKNTICIFKLVPCSVYPQLFQKLTFFGFKVVFLMQFYRPVGIYTVVERINIHRLEWILHGLVWIGEVWMWPLQ